MLNVSPVSDAVVFVFAGNDCVQLSSCDVFCIHFFDFFVDQASFRVVEYSVLYALECFFWYLVSDLAYHFLEVFLVSEKPLVCNPLVGLHI